MNISKKKKPDVFVELEIESSGFNGVSVGRIDGMVHFVEGAVPGDTVRARLTKNKKNYVECKTVEILQKSENRIEPLCEHFDNCGGCKRQDLIYSEQLKWKELNVKESFQRLHKVEVGNFEKILNAPKEFYYRNKMEFSFANKRWLTPEEMNNQDKEENPIIDKNFAFGLHIAGAFDKVLDLNICHLQQHKANEIFQVTKKYLKSNNITANSAREHTGLLRNLIIRHSQYEDNFMIILITNPNPDENEMNHINIWAKIIFDFDYVSSVIFAQKELNSPVKIIEHHTLYGKDYLLEDILGVKFQISPFSFFQTNPSQLNNFIQSILDYSELQSDEILWDLYCGTGSISLPASKFVKKVIGLELVESSIFDAKSNSALNDITNTEFYAVDLHTKTLPDIFRKIDKPDNIIIDPPRAGIHNNVINHLLELEIPKITYVSCNPTTMARDCELLSEKYEIITVKPVDMFPQTYHIEAIAKLRLKK